MPDEIAFPVERDPVASILILAWKSAPYLLDCLRSVDLSVRRVPYEVVLVLNEPSRELSSMVERYVRGAVVVRSRVNLGYGGAMNIAARHARGSYLVLLNDDAEVMPGWLEQLVAAAERRPDAGAVGSTTLFYDGTIQEAGCVIWSDGSTVKVGRNLPAGSLQYDFERKVDFCSGTSLLIRHDTWDKLEGMDADTYFPAYYEDTDLCLRIASELHQEVWYQPRSMLRHRESAATNETYRAFLFDRNKAIFSERWVGELARRDAPDPVNPTAVEHAAWLAMGAPKRVLLIDDQLPDPSIGSGYPRMLETLSELIGLGCHLSMFTSLIEGADHTDGMCRLGVRVLDGSFEDDLREHLSSVGVGYDAVIISRPHNFERFAPVVRLVHPETPVIYDAEALFHRRIERQAEVAPDEVRRGELTAEAAAMRETEMGIARQADGLVAIFEEEANFLRQYARVPVHVHGPILANVQPTEAGFAERSDIGYVAGWAGGANSPNADALAWFAHEILPRVLARVPGARLLVTGLNPPESVLRFAGHSVVFLGSVEELADFYRQIRVAIVPMRIGAGVKNKTIEALQHGVPTVSTVVGAEGVPVDADDVLLVDDDPQGFALRVAGLLSDRQTWELQRHRVLEQVRRWGEEASAWPGILATAADPKRGAVRNG